MPYDIPNTENLNPLFHLKLHSTNFFCERGTTTTTTNRFEKSFEFVGYSKKEWIEQEMSPGPGIYGWIAREDDYNSEGPLGDYLRQNGELKTISNIMEEETNAMKTLLEYNEKSMSSSRMLEEHDRLHHSFYEGL